MIQYCADDYDVTANVIELPYGFTSGPDIDEIRVWDQDTVVLVFKLEDGKWYQTPSDVEPWGSPSGGAFATLTEREAKAYARERDAMIADE